MSFGNPSLVYSLVINKTALFIRVVAMRQSGTSLKIISTIIAMHRDYWYKNN